MAKNHSFFTHNSSYKRFWWTFFLFLILSISLISAFEFDNTYKYNPETKEVLIENAFGLGDDIAKLQLITPTEVIVPRGYNKVAEFTIEGKTDYEDIIGAFKLINLRDSKSISREIDVKYLDYEMVDVQDWKTECIPDSKSMNGSVICNDIKDGTHKEQREVWRDFKDITDGEKKTIGLFTDVQKGDFIDWIPNIAGVEIKEWATWSESLSVGLFRYYNMDETSGNAIENVYGIYNLTDAGAVVHGESGIIDTSSNFTGESTSYLYSDPTGIPEGANLFTYNMWFYREVDCADYDQPFSFGDNAGANMFWFICHPANTVDFYISSSHWTPGCVIPPNSWNMYTITYNGSLLSFYVNGVLNGTKEQELTIDLGDEYFVIGGRSQNNKSIDAQVNMKIDEVGLWNRTLNTIEIEDLWNGGSGITYTSEFEPSITMNSPANNYASTNLTVTFNCSATDDVGVLNLSFYVDEVLNYTITNSTANENLSLELLRTIPYGDHNWSCEATDTDNLASRSSRVFNLTTYTVNSQTYNSSSIENSHESFIINITYVPAVWNTVVANLYYNGTTYSSSSTTSGTDTLFSRTITIPTTNVSGNMSFKWMFTLLNSTGTGYYNYTETNQYITRLNASILGSPEVTNFINFSIYDEETLTPLNTTFAITLNYGITSFIRSLAYEQTDYTLNTSSYSFGFSPNTTILVKGSGEYTASSYITRLYTLPTQYINNITTNISLYLLNSSKSTTFIVYVRDSSYVDVVGGAVYIQRYYPGTDTWTTIEVVETNDEGKALGHFVTEDVFYRFLVYVDGTLELTSTPTKIFCEASPCTITLTLPGESGYVQESNLSNLDYSFTYSPSTEAFTYTYTDSDADAAGGRLYVFRANFGNITKTTICNTSSSASSGVLTCDITNYVNGTYYGYAYNIRNTTELLQILIVQKTRNTINNFGLDGLIWAAFFIIAIVMIGLVNPAVAITFAVGGVIFVSLLGIAVIPYVSLFAIITIGVYLLWNMK